MADPKPTKSETARKPARWRAEILEHGLSAVIYEDTDVDGCRVHIARLDGTPGYPVVKHARLIAEAPAMKAWIKLIYRNIYASAGYPTRQEWDEARAILARIDGEGGE